jgi:hypothetical protein
MTLELDTAAAAIVVDHPFVPRGNGTKSAGISSSERTA